MRITHIIGFTLTMALTACSGKESTPKEMPVVAHIEEVNGERLTACQLDLLTDTVDIPLSDLVEELQFVKLDNLKKRLWAWLPFIYLTIISWWEKVIRYLSNSSIGTVDL